MHDMGMFCTLQKVLVNLMQMDFTIGLNCPRLGDRSSSRAVSLTFVLGIL
jgi:hypothetical protein